MITRRELNWEIQWEADNVYCFASVFPACMEAPPIALFTVTTHQHQKRMNHQLIPAKTRVCLTNMCAVPLDALPRGAETGDRRQLQKHGLPVLTEIVYQKKR
jgi:hypothetical protein